MNPSKPRNCHRVGVRQLAFELDVYGRRVHAGITCEAALGRPSAEIPDGGGYPDACARVEADYTEEIAQEVAKRVRAEHPGDRGRPIFLTSMDFLKPLRPGPQHFIDELNASVKRDELYRQLESAAMATLIPNATTPWGYDIFEGEELVTAGATPKSIIIVGIFAQHFDELEAKYQRLEKELRENQGN